MSVEVIVFLTIASAAGITCWQPIAALTDEIAHAVGDIGIEEASAVICKPGRQLEQRDPRAHLGMHWNRCTHTFVATRLHAT